MRQTDSTQEFAHPALVELPRIAVTKTKPPAVRKFAVERPRLLGVLDAAGERRLILFKAPAGYGKTTLAVEWCQRLREAGAIVAWLSLDADDDEPGAFAYNVVRAVEIAAPNLSRDAVELLQAASLIPAPNVVASLLNAVSEIDGDFYLFLDDFHLIADVRCHDLIRYVLRYAPSNLHLVLVSRIEPPFPLSQVRLDDEILEINATLLSFNLQETMHFLGEALISRLGQSGVEKLHLASEGWPAALQLARIALVKSPDGAFYMHGFSGTTRTISEFFEHTLASEPAAAVDFLLKTSILDQMTGSLCNAVTGTSDGSSMLHRLEREQFLLVPLDEVGGWYRYHHLLREYLTDRLNAQMVGQISELNRRAYRWFATRAQWTTAVQLGVLTDHLRVQNGASGIRGGDGDSDEAPTGTTNTTLQDGGALSYRRMLMVPRCRESRSSDPELMSSAGSQLWAGSRSKRVLEEFQNGPWYREALHIERRIGRFDQCDARQL